MRKAAERAKKLGEDEVARLIEAQCQEYEEAPRLTASDVYSQIEDVVMDTPHLDFHNVIVYVGRDFGASPEELLATYKRARRVFDEAQNRKREYKELRQKRSETTVANQA